MRSSAIQWLALAAATLGCSALTPRVTPEGNIAFGAPNAATGEPGASVMTDQGDREHAPRPHVARSAFDRWRPAPLGVLPPDSLLHNTSTPVRIELPRLAVTLRASDSLVPAWGGDFYVRVDVRAGTPTTAGLARELAVVVDPRDGGTLNRARFFAAALLETLRAGDHGTLVTGAEGGRVLVPRLPYAGTPLLIERARALEVGAQHDLAAAVAHGVQQLLGGSSNSLRRLVLISGVGSIVDGETREWIEVAQRSGIEVRLLPLSAGTARRFTALGNATEAVALAVPGASAHDEDEVVEELAALPPDEPLVRELSLVVDSLPGPLHLLEVAGASALWGPSGSEVPLGDVRAGEVRTVVLRGSVPAWQPGFPYELAVRVRWRDQDVHEIRRSVRAEYTDSPTEYAASRAGDVLQYVSLINTLSRVQAALARRDDATLLALRGPARLQAETLRIYARDHDDAIMSEQAELMLEFLSAPGGAIARSR